MAAAKDAKDAKIAELEQALRDSKRRCDALEELRVHLSNYRVLRSEMEQMRKCIGSCSKNAFVWDNAGRGC